ncbi:YppG family protein [Paraliobacillus sp. JSM ZJ581]|uniref:YppG family protein n=1 Tax=Paraliobacillus sp. JSM ZJ581 TaxID=3342118 RepID=UPI0035A95991
MSKQRRAPFPFQPYQNDPTYFYNNPNAYGQKQNNAMQKQTNVSTPYQYFSKPPHPAEWYPEQSQSAFNTYGQQAKGFIQYFQDKDGQMDLDKMLSTVGQVANTYQQVTPMIKGIGSFLKGFK